MVGVGPDNKPILRTYLDCDECMGPLRELRRDYIEPQAQLRGLSAVLIPPYSSLAAIIEGGPPAWRTETYYTLSRNPSTWSAHDHFSNLLLATLTNSFANEDGYYSWTIVRRDMFGGRCGCCLVPAMIARRIWALMRYEIARMRAAAPRTRAR